MPVLDMIHVVAHNPKYVNTGVQTDCQINSFKAHIFTQVNFESLAEQADTNLIRMQMVMNEYK